MEQKASTEENDYDEFLENWQPSRLLQHTTLDSNLFDPLAQARLQADSTAIGDVPRTVNAPGIKLMTEEESNIRRFNFFERTKEEWSEDFRDRLLTAQIEVRKVDEFIHAMANMWVKGPQVRQDSEIMRRIKASIQLHDRFFHRKTAGLFVTNAMPDDIDPFFDVLEVQNIFEINKNMVEAYVAHYLSEFPLDIGNSINMLHVRRGVAMPAKPETVRKELHYLSSFSLAMTPAEQFAQTYSKKSATPGYPCIFSAPIPAIQDRIVAFAPFIKDMSIDQLEFVVAPPIVESPLTFNGLFAGIDEYSFS